MHSNIIVRSLKYNTKMLRQKLYGRQVDEVKSPHKRRKLSDFTHEPSESSTENKDNSMSSESKYFSENNQNANLFEKKIINVQLELNNQLTCLTFKDPVKYKYNPVEYAFKGNESYIYKFCKGPKKLLFVGMNPGPFGMCQTGVPFGDVKMVRDWLGIEEEISKPPLECPNRPIQGFQCPRGEVSGDRLWGLFRKLCSNPERFFQNCFVYNYCPLAFMDRTGRNVTPRDMKGGQKQLEEVCDKFFGQIVDLIQPEKLIGIGEYAEKRCQNTIKLIGKDIPILRLPHPSPRSPNNTNWPQKAENFLSQHDLLQYL